MDKVRVLSIGGTRPEAIKLAPLCLAAAYRPALDHRTLATGQQAMFRDSFAEFGLVPDLWLPPTPHDPDPDVMVGRFETMLRPVLHAERPDMVVVQGDTSSAYAGALAAFAAGIPVAHVEAGLRSGDFSNPWPEERNRVAINALATLLFAPTVEAASRLAGEPAVGGAVHVTGNTGIDALRWMRGRTSRTLHEDPRRLVLLTCHRRESFGAGIARICAAALELAERGDVRIVCPVHTNSVVEAAVREALGRHSGITLVPPLCYRETVALMAAASLILTDSGGIQEEAPALGTPTLVLRAVTERQEGIASGNLRLVGTDTDRIVAAATELLDDDDAHTAMAHIAYPFGQPGAAIKILDHVEQFFSVAAPPDRTLPSTAFWSTDGAPKGT